MKKREEEQTNRKSKQQEKEQANRENDLPSMPKGETVGNVFIDGKGDGKESSIEAKEMEKKAT